MIFRRQIISTARSYLHTPFHHQGRLKGVGIDCIGLLVGVAQELGLSFHDYTGYRRQPRPDTLNREIAQDTVETPKEQARPGDIVCFWIARKGVAQHTGILTDKGLIHTFADVGRVVEHTLNCYWAERVHCIRRWSEVSDVESELFVWPTPEAQIPRGFHPSQEESCCG